MYRTSSLPTLPWRFVLCARDIEEPIGETATSAVFFNISEGTMMNEHEALLILRLGSIEIGPDEPRSVIEIATAHQLGNVAVQKTQEQDIIRSDG